MTQQLVQEPLMRFVPAEKPEPIRILCNSTRQPIEPVECFCCSGAGCWLHHGARRRLELDLVMRPGHYADKPWVSRAVRLPIIGVDSEADLDE